MEGIFIIIGIIVIYYLFFKPTKTSNTYSNHNYSKPSHQFYPKVSNENVKNNGLINKPDNIVISKIKTPEKVVEVKPIFLPLTDLNFKASFDTGRYKFHYLYDYYPVNRFPSNTISQTDLQNRYSLFQIGATEHFHTLSLRFVLA